MERVFLFLDGMFLSVRKRPSVPRESKAKEEKAIILDFEIH